MFLNFTNGVPFVKILLVYAFNDPFHWGLPKKAFDIYTMYENIPYLI